MKRPVIAVLIALTVVPSLARAQEPDVDRAMRERIYALQRQAEKAMAAQSGAGLYRPAKALAWLDLALHELYEEDRTGIIEDSVAQAERVLAAETNEAAFDTPIPRATERVREDLWTKAAEIRSSKNFHCAAREVGQLEVQLIWAGHEKWESGWSHARPAVEVADNLVYDAEMAQRNCASPPAKEEKVTLSGEALFPFGKAGINQISAQGRAKLDELARGLKQWKSIERIDVIGHTDRIGDPEYNDKLSSRRAQNIRAYLIKQGLPAKLIFASGRGGRTPLVTCPDITARKALIDCLRANRRVEISVQGER